MSCCVRTDADNEARDEERGTLLRPPQEQCREGRQNADGNNNCFLNAASIILKFMFCTSGYWLTSSCCVVYSIYILLICWFQVVYDLFVVLNCPYFDCRFLQKEHHHQNTSNAQRNPTRAAQNATYTLASLGGCFSYTWMLYFLWVSGKSKKNSIVPYTVFRDLNRKHMAILFWFVTFLTCVYVASVSLFYYMIRNQPKNKNFVILVIGVGSQFVAQWTGITSCFVFGASTLAVGKLTLTEDCL